MPPVYLGLPNLSLDKQRDRLVWAPGLASLLSAHTHKSFVASLPGLGSAEEKQSRLPGLGTLSHCVQVETGEAEPRGGPLRGGGCPKKKLSSGQASCFPNLTTRLPS